MPTHTHTHRQTHTLTHTHIHTQVQQAQRHISQLMSSQQDVWLASPRASNSMQVDSAAGVDRQERGDGEAPNSMRRQVSFENMDLSGGRARRSGSGGGGGGGGGQETRREGLETQMLGLDRTRLEKGMSYPQEGAIKRGREAAPAPSPPLEREQEEREQEKEKEREREQKSSEVTQAAEVQRQVDYQRRQLEYERLARLEAEKAREREEERRRE